MFTIMHTEDRSIMANGTLKVGTITTSSGSGNITIGSGVTVNVNRPAWYVKLSGDQDVSECRNLHKSN